MAAVTAVLHRHRNVLLIDVILLAALYLVPALSHATALPIYLLEPMRVVLIVALLFTNRANTYFIAVSIPLASVLLTGHPEPIKALLMCIEFSVLVAAYDFLSRRLRVPAFAALTAGILLGKVVYYTLKAAVLGAGWLSGSLVSTPVKYQVALAIGTAAAFALAAYFRPGNKPAP